MCALSRRLEIKFADPRAAPGRIDRLYCQCFRKVRNECQCANPATDHGGAVASFSEPEFGASTHNHLGHKTSGMVWTYAKIRDAQLVEAARNLKLRTGA